MRVDGSSTVKLNASEASTADPFAPATFLDASKNGERVFFMTAQALTDDTPAGGDEHLYMYDASLAPSAPHHLTLINSDEEPGDGTSANARGVVGTSNDGSYVYFVSDGQIVRGQPLLGGIPGLYVWHDGTVRYIKAVAGFLGGELFTTGAGFVVNPRQSRVTPYGRWLLYRMPTGPVEQLYLYSADSGTPPVCVSCDPSGGPTAAIATDATNVNQANGGATSPSWHENHALSADGSVFFSTAQALVPGDVNGRADVYEYEPSVGRVFLISGGTDAGDSWFMDASPDGRNVFFTTRQQLVGWDADQEYDVYDARVGGGFPDPPSTPVCMGDGCQGALVASPVVQSAGSAVFSGAGNTSGKLKPRMRPCRRGFVRKRVRGRVRCVRRPKRHVKASRSRVRARRAGHGGGAS